MTLVEFLLARIAEDERNAVTQAERRRDEALASAASFGYSYLVVGGPTDPARLLADCEAKRRIVEHHHVECGGHPGAWMPHGDYGRGYCAREDEDNSTLLYLASAYADHPDYREEWRP